MTRLARVKGQFLTLLILSSLSFSLAQDNPIMIRLEHYIVSLITDAEGNKQEKLTEATTARPKQVVEYRLFISNRGETTLPPGTVVITGPVPEGTHYVDGSATQSSETVLTEYSADGENFSEAPVIITMLDEEGIEQKKIVNPEDYKAVRWTLLIPSEPEQEDSLFYRVTVD